MGDTKDCQGVQLVSSQHGNRNGSGRETKMLVKKTREKFLEATTAKKYKAALRAALKLKGKDQLLILDALFAAADRLKVERTTGEPLGMRQQLDGSVIVTWATATRRPDGSEVKVTSTAVLEPAEEGPGWKADEIVPDEVVEAVTAAAMADQLKAARTPHRRRRIYVR